LHVAGTKAQLQPAVAKQVERGRFAGQQDGVAEVVVEDERADPDGRGGAGGGDEGRDWREQLGEVVGDQQGAKSQVFDSPGFLDPLGARVGGAEVDAETERAGVLGVGCWGMVMRSCLPVEAGTCQAVAADCAAAMAAS
jgi:hypothetical protein